MTGLRGSLQVQPTASFPAHSLEAGARGTEGTPHFCTAPEQEGGLTYGHRHRTRHLAVSREPHLQPPLTAARHIIVPKPQEAKGFASSHTARRRAGIQTQSPRVPSTMQQRNRSAVKLGSSCYLQDVFYRTRIRLDSVQAVRIMIKSSYGHWKSSWGPTCSGGQLGMSAQETQQAGTRIPRSQVETVNSGESRDPR